MIVCFNLSRGKSLFLVDILNSANRMKYKVHFQGVSLQTSAKRCVILCVIVKFICILCETVNGAMRVNNKSQKNIDRFFNVLIKN
jgi:hypothetical protein